MFAKHVLVTATLAIAAAAAMTANAMAADDNAPSYDSFVSTKDRAEVRQEVRDARASGSLIGAGDAAVEAHAEQARFTSPKSRAQLRAEVAQARRDGTLVPAGEGGLSPIGTFVSSRDPNEVKAEARAEVRTHAFEQKYLP